MSWASRLGNLGRFSPFTRSPPQGSTKVSDADFSYITADDLRRHQAESMNAQGDTEDYGPPRDTDVLILRNKKQEYAVHFPAYSIAKGELNIGQVRDQAAKKTGVGDPRRIKLLYKGKNLKDDSRAAKSEGLKDGAELMCTIAEPMSPSDSDEDDEFGDALIESGTADGETRRKRNRGKKTRRRNKRGERDGASGTSTPQPGQPNLGVPNSQQPSRTQSPRPAASPASPFDKLNALHQKLQSYIPDCEKFLAAPPTDHAKKEFEHKRLTETILAQVLLKLDGVETEGDEDARSQRKALVRETQAVLNRLDAMMKSS
ncbi:BCL2-associated athanogene-like protein [Pseudocercospora fijiensis CIRAD86]|uniref:BCL2-associated athanogene-like protein n=1 Tax=Pseudocercospora fijiensis (strain CIRAD86) TaxID=383855 RepID=N1Q8I4_PSEFD|nr:BCL2-associated athanogene-like protein [Pseudocercospora fijiensis CIRAD86]EME88111.1 BCL2-associated athanogene-like protein [Pseudocercospora fijiensis CIRAD86]